MTTRFSINDAITNHADYLNQLNEKRERVVKASRDITISSKWVIFQEHRYKNTWKQQHSVSSAKLGLFASRGDKC
ncbi:hypothetical protein FNV43_RR26356 [Rhamnella rubrinervis]|uniref:Uncharacterized protein n=1 Tax=Rhamnella rubrinervis TaxID=2594499 RepID=A0A8K0DPP6_9ROSA|nr:hypothetical protein FNV43_RR26356 [Rhamnella rubrinervis]